MALDDTEAGRLGVVALVALALVALLGLTGAPVAVAGGVLLLVVALGATAPAAMLVASVAALPWFFHPVEFGSQRFAASELLLIIAVASSALALVHVLFAAPDRRAAVVESMSRAVDAMRSPLVAALLVLTVVGLAGSLWPFDPAQRAASLREWRWTLVEPLLLVVLLRWHDDGRRLRTMLAGGFVLGATVAAALAFAGILTDAGVRAGGVTRLSGPYPHPNALALLSTRAALFAAAWALFDPRARRMLVPPVLVLTLATLATFSRGALLGLASGGGLLIPALPRRERAVAIGGAVVTMGAMIVVGRDRMLDLFAGGSGTLRFAIWRSALAMIGDRPWRGYGPDQFLYAYVPRYIDPLAWSERFTAHAHNLVIDFWIRLGIIGGAFAALAAAVIVLNALRLTRERASTRPLRSAAIVALFGALVHALVDNGYFAHDLAMSAWLLGWLAFDSGRTAAEEGTTRARPRRGRRRFHRIASR